MTKTVRCVCGETLTIDNSDPSASATCPKCGQAISSHSAATAIPDEAFEPSPSASSAESDPPLWLRLLLDPQTIRRLLFVGGGVSVLGIIAWLVSLGVFDDPRILAVALGTGTTVMMAAGWLVTLRTQHRLAGQALTFLACVVAPLNLWFYDAQGLVTIDGHLWVGALVCSLAYLATVYVLKDPLFLYAFELGITLTTLLILGDVQRVTDSDALCAALLALGILSIHIERAFAVEHPIFSRRRFGLPLFFSGQTQVAVAMVSLLVLQVIDWLWLPGSPTHWGYSRIATTPWLAGTLWLTAAYVWFYSDLVVRKLGIYSYLGALALVLAQVTLLQDVLTIDGLIAALAVTSIAVRALVSFRTESARSWATAAESIGFAVGLVPLGMAIYRHFAADFDLGILTEHLEYTGALGVVTISLCLSGAIGWAGASRLRSAFWSCGALALAMTGLHGLALLNVTDIAYALPTLLALPLGTAVVLSLLSPQGFRRDLLTAAHAFLVSLIVFCLFATGSATTIEGLIVSHGRQLTTFLAALICAELAAFYFVSATQMSHRIVVSIFGGFWALAAALKFVQFTELSEAYYAPLLAGVGVVLSIIGRLTQPDETLPASDNKRMIPTWSAAGDIVLVVAELSAFLRGLVRLISPSVTLEAWTIAMVALTAGLAFAGALLTMTSAARRWHTAAATCVGLVAVASCIKLWDLRDYQKIELATVIVGGLMIVAGYVGRLRESQRDRDAGVSLALWAGSLIATVPILWFTLGNRWFEPQVSLFDELGLLTVGLLLLASGCIFQVRSTTTFGAAGLTIYLVSFFAHLAWRPEVAVGVYLAVGGGVIFLMGVALSIYRDRLLALPSKIAQREGIFQVIDWR